MKNTLLVLALIVSLVSVTVAVWSLLNEKQFEGSSVEAWKIPSLIYSGAGRTDLKSLSLGSGATTTSYTNTTESTEWVKLASITSSGTASSSFDYYLFASTSKGIPTSHDFTDIVPGANSRILTGTLATSTTATTTNNIMGTVLSRSDGFVEVKVGHSVIFALQKGDQNCLSLPAVNGCEAATSTNRGFNLNALFETYSTSTKVR